jgi:predicted nucleic acid-binding protein
MPGISRETLIIVDADAIISFVATDDENHARAKEIMQYVATIEAYMLFPTTAICEAVTVLKRKLNKPEDAANVVKKFQSGNFPIQAVDQETLTFAGDFFNPYGSKQNTLFDAVIAALAKTLYADAIFSFDRWYKTQGFTLAGELLGEKQAA